MNFPYLINKIDSNVLQKLFDYKYNLKVICDKNIKNFSKFKEKIYVIEENYYKVSSLNKITDFFSQRTRMHCATKGNISPYAYFIEHKNKLNAIKDPFKRRKIILKNAKDCSLFNITRCISLMRFLFKDPTNKKWLDPSSGWGDRLIASLVLNMEYHGNDPSEKMETVYKHIVKHFNKNSEKHFVIKQPFEQANLNKNYYDVVFTSPPFYDTEIYNLEESQSITNKSYDQWINDFFLVMIQKSYESLKYEGYLVLYYEDKILEAQKLNVVEEIPRLIKTKLNYNYLGALNFKYDDVDKVRKFMVWQKHEMVK